jgi:hypothetical protein
MLMLGRQCLGDKPFIDGIFKVYRKEIQGTSNAKGQLSKEYFKDILRKVVMDDRNVNTE